eukprot:TRINITY_DN18098_c0_g1_i1.p1 TRINITY_DN18098_c0_g1~~TRINITY_DN18098_c0_g1_i1.p1  ORF type:complete len:462 (+),score=61.43 TRINITY_DN18098_c0_g1_i1:166-1551(+)
MSFLNKISVASLNSSAKSGWLTKQGGSISTWKRRWFILKDDKLYYFKTIKDIEVTGIIPLGSGAACKEESYQVRKKKHCFSVKPSNSAKRVYFIFADNADDCKSWIAKINEAINEKGSRTSARLAELQQDFQLEVDEDKKVRSASVIANNLRLASGARKLIIEGKSQIEFLKKEDHKALEFWQVWFDSIPETEDFQKAKTPESKSLIFTLTTSLTTEKLTWRAAGPQNLFIQRMVDFFWNVGAPETEIDKLNEVGTRINPVVIGSWIDMSIQGGMDGGWYFPFEIPLDVALTAADDGDSLHKLVEWAQAHKVERCVSVGRDMGAAPPRQIELRLILPGVTFADQLEIALDAYQRFEVIPPSHDELQVIRENSDECGLVLVVVTSVMGFVRVGLLFPLPSEATVKEVCRVRNVDYRPLEQLQTTMQVPGPAFLEFSFLNESFTYGVYPQGFDVYLHFVVGGN